MDSNEYKEKMEWIKSLRVGDTVCDCRLRHIKIKSITNDTVVKFPRWLRNIIFANWMPMVIGNLMYDVVCWISRKANRFEIADRTIVLEDGAQCSAMHCCDKDDHSHQT
jgi:hypothetical protein